MEQFWIEVNSIEKETMERGRVKRRKAQNNAVSEARGAGGIASSWRGPLQHVKPLG